MLATALIALLGEGGLLGFVKIAFCVLGAMAVSYGVNKCALDRGAPLAVVGYRSAAIISILAILSVGAGLGAATYAGLTLSDVTQLRHDAHGAALVEHASARAGDTAQGAAFAPILASIAEDLEKKAACERISSCVSGRAAGGRGLVARTLETMAERAKGIAVQFDAGVMTGTARSGEIANLLSRYATVSGSNDSSSEKRVKLQAIDTQLRQALAARKQAAPVALADAYAAELQKPVVITGQAEASRALTAILQAHAQSLRGVPAAITTSMPAPNFPKAAGVADTFTYVGHFLPIAAITLVVELIFPIVLWTYVALTLAWEIERQSPRPRRSAHEDDEASLRILGGPRRAVAPEPTDPEAYFRSNPQRRANGDDRHGSH
ncbi:hypothetical protein [Bosea sp. (in: a-proteobacteria)]|uniref:hypothetical protein n=1 Tax=Bosea sp. (in: a-proteobacteria) TaxID=1871050 RepID=UPI0035695CFE